jgi:putative cell wall-binding protein
MTANQAANAAANVAINRVSGATRYDTSAAIASTKYPTGVTSGNVVLAVGTNFPDALAGNYLAGQLSAPILLTPSSTTDPNYAKVTTELAKLLPGTTKRVYILGGTAAIGADVATDLTGKGYTVTRIGGATRYDTAQMVNTQTGQTPGNGVSGNRTALLVTGANFPDALAGGPLAWAKKFPVVLTDGTQPTLSTQATATFTADGIKNVIILGGASAINPGINTALTTAGITVDKQFAGTDRTDTAAQLATYIVATYGFSNASAILASGGNFPDALSAGPWGGDPQPLLLTLPDGSLGTSSTNYLKSVNTSLLTINIPGGTAAVSDATATAAQQAATLAGANGTFTTGPELVSATILQTVTTAAATPSQPAGTYVQYLFDEPISAGSPLAASFAVYHSANPALPVGGSVLPATVSATNASAVVVIFPGLNTAALAGDLTIASVVGGAVQDLQGQLNPVGSAAIGTAGSTTSGQGRSTAAPNLLSIGGFRPACADQFTQLPVGGGPCPTAIGVPAGNMAGDTAVDFTFDKAATIQAGAVQAGPTAAGAGPPAAAPAAGNFNLVLASGQEESCATPTGGVADNANPGGGNSPGGNNTTVITVVCRAAPSTPTTPLTIAQVARGIIRTGSVIDTATATFLNPLQSEPSIHTSSVNPELVSGTFTPGNTAGCLGTATPCDLVLYTFNQAVNLTGAGGENALFHLYGTTGAQTNPAAVAQLQASTSGPNTIGVFYPAGTIAAVTPGGGPAVGISVDAAAVTSPNTLTIGTNLNDEVGVSNGSTVAQTPGHTSVGANLASIAQSPIKNAFGTITSYAETYTFDKPLGSAAAPFAGTGAGGTLAGPGAASFVVYNSDNTQLSCDPVLWGKAGLDASWSAANPNSVTCGAWVITTTGAGASLNQQTTAISGGVIGVTGALPPDGGAVAPSNTGDLPGPQLATSGPAFVDALSGMPNTTAYVGITGTTGTPQFG